MAEEGTLCENGDVEKIAGANTSGTSDAEAYTNVYIKMAEGYICTACRYDWVTNYSSVSTIGKEILRLATAAMAANYAITYDIGGFITANAQTTIQNNWDTIRECVNLLSEDAYRKFVLQGDMS